MNDLDSLVVHEEQAKEDGLIEKEQYENQSSEESRKDKENNLAKVEIPVLVKDSQETVITSTSHNNKTIALLATKLVTPETYRKKKRYYKQNVGSLNRNNERRK